MYSHIGDLAKCNQISQESSSVKTDLSGATLVCINSTTVYALSDTGRVLETGVAGTDDGRVIQAAVDATTNGTVLLREGVYTLAGPTVSHPRRGNICIDKSNIHLKGEGDTTILRSRSTNDEYAIVANGQEFNHIENVTISDLRIEMGSLEQIQAGYGGIWLWYADRCHIDNVSIVNSVGWADECISWEGIYLFSGNYSHVTNCNIKGLGGGSNIPWHEGNALNLQNAHHNSFDAVSITDCIYGIHVGYDDSELKAHARSNDNTFTNITIDGNRYGIYVRSESQNNQFINNIVTNSERVGALLESGIADSFVGCTFHSAPAGVLVCAKAVDTRIENCNFGAHSHKDLIDGGSGTVIQNSSYTGGSVQLSHCQAYP